jgi:hypothetical protein
LRSNDYLVIGPIGSRNDFITFYKASTGIKVNCGCFNGTFAEFEAKNEETHKDNSQFLEEYHATIDYFRRIQKARGFVKC